MTAERVRFMVSISSVDGWSYAVDQEVVVGRAFGDGEIPQDAARSFLASGIAEAVAAPGQDEQHQPKRRGRRRSTAQQ